jgi:hypothetical protein
MLLFLLALAAVGPLPRLLHPPLTQQQLAGLKDQKERLEAQDARLERQDAARATLLQG